MSNLCDFPHTVRAGRRVVARSRIDPALPSAEVDAARATSPRLHPHTPPPHPKRNPSLNPPFSSPSCAAQPISPQALRQLAEKREPAYSVDSAWLAAARPGLVITQAVCGVGPGETPSAVAAALAEAGLLSAGSETTTLVMRARTLAEVLESITHVGAATGASFRAASFKDRLQERLRAVAAAVAAAPRRRPRVLSIEGLKPLVTGGHWLTEMKARSLSLPLSLLAPGGPKLRGGTPPRAARLALRACPTSLELQSLQVIAGGADDLQEVGSPAERLRWEQARPNPALPRRRQ